MRALQSFPGVLVILECEVETLHCEMEATQLGEHQWVWSKNESTEDPCMCGLEKSLALSYLAFVQNFQRREALGPSSQRHSRKSRQIRGKIHPGECICNRQESGTVLEESNIPLLFQVFQIKHCYPGQGASSFRTSEAAPAPPQKAALRFFDEHSFL